MDNFGRTGIEAWLGEALGSLTEGQMGAITGYADEVTRLFPDEVEDRAEWDAALSAAMQVMLRETSLTDLGRALDLARSAERVAMAAVQGGIIAASETGVPEMEIARQAGVNRQTVRRVLGK
ncbi:hypothetical protein GCM10009785_26550 [Brooklawnia cerclae]|uniref:Uncharacterized protein n=1 Tax=Brooklawnia cerclae TaxID=349934 RepID=A0ABX0SG77_9ACTN|nr:hypothetical protein [Brooklawnia cerclae]NIH57339.1 hypothetical protein [Brooklawnia cerclae]